MIKLLILLTVVLLYSCGGLYNEYVYECRDNKGRRIELSFHDYYKIYLDNPIKVGDTVYYEFGNIYMVDKLFNPAMFYDRAVVTKLK